MASKRNVILEFMKTTILDKIDGITPYTIKLKTKSRNHKSKSQLRDEEFPAVFVSSADEIRENQAQSEFISEMTIFLTGYVTRPNDSFGLQPELDKLIEDLTRAIMSDPGMGCNASVVEIRSIDTDSGDDQSHATMVMQVVVTYRGSASAP